VRMPRSTQFIQLKFLNLNIKTQTFFFFFSFSESLDNDFPYFFFFFSKNFPSILLADFNLNKIIKI
jgi:hypothetical protein